MLRKAVFVILTLTGIQAYNQKVCKTWFDYYVRPFSKNCWYEADVGKNIPEILEHHFGAGGYENYSVTTQDGYILGMFRILRDNPKGIVILQHPVSSDGIIYVSQGNESTAITFWNEGYEVWIPNNRGTWYSEKHVNLTINQFKYWDFTFHEIGMYDYPAIFEKISQVTGSNDLVFIGHSMAVSSSMVYASLQPEHAKNHIKILIQMGPITYFEHVKSPLSYVAPLANIFRKFTNLIHIGGMFTAHSFLEKAKNFLAFLPVGQIGLFIINLFCGWTPHEFDPKMFPLMTVMPRGFSLGVYYHYAQIVNAKGRFQMWNYGKKKNRLVYQSEQPPEYPVEKIQVPVYLMSSTGDSCATTGDADVLFNKLSPKSKIYGQYKTTGLNHIGYHWGKDRNKVYKHMLELLNHIL